jgi:hypothetical protein
VDGSHLEVDDAATGQRVLQVAARPWEPIAVSPDGERIALEDDRDAGTRTIVVRRVADGAELAQLKGAFLPEWSADGAFLSVTEAGRADTGRIVYDAASWGEVWRHDGYASVAWSPSGARLAVTGPDSSFEVHDFGRGRTDRLPVASFAPITSLAPDGEGGLVVHAGRSASCQVARIDRSGATSTAAAPCDAPGKTSSPDGALHTVLEYQQSAAALVAPSWNLYVEDGRGGRWFVEHGWSGMPEPLWSTRGHDLLLVQPQTLFYEADSQRPWAVRVRGTRAAAIDSTGERVAVATADGAVLVVRPRVHEAPVVLPGPVPLLQQEVLLALEGDRLALATHDGDIVVWDVTTKSQLANWSLGFAPQHVAWSAGGRLLTASHDDTLRIARADGSGAVTLGLLASPGGASILARDEQGRVDGTSDAIALARWRAPGPAGQARWLTAASVEAELHVGPLRSGMLAALYAE